MIPKDNHRTIRLDLDVSVIAQALADKRQLSQVLSELLRKEYGVNFEEDQLKSKISELKRQQSEINEQMKELKHTLELKSIKENNSSIISQLENELQLLEFNKRQEFESIVQLKIEDLGIVKEGLKDHELMSEISKMKGRKRQEIQKKYSDRHNEILLELEWRYLEKENMSGE